MKKEVPTQGWNPWRPLSRPLGFGSEVGDPRSLSISTGDMRPPTLEQTIARVMRQHAATRALTGLGVDETEEESEDFDIPSDPADALTKFEHAADALPLNEVRARLRDAVVQQPHLYDTLKETFGHLFKRGDFPKQAPPKVEPAPGAVGGGPHPSEGGQT